MILESGVQLRVENVELLQFMALPFVLVFDLHFSYLSCICFFFEHAWKLVSYYICVDFLWIYDSE